MQSVPKIELARERSRRGVALLIVMIAVSASLVLTLTFMQSQTVSVSISENLDHGRSALDAARTGAAAAFALMQSPEWEGVATPLTGTLGADTSGTISYTVTYHRVDPTDTLAALAAALLVEARSTGTFTPTDATRAPIEKTVTFVAELKPRLPGRTIGAGDDAALDDLAPWPTDWGTIQDYTITARGVGADPLAIEPRTGVSGDVFLSGSTVIFDTSNGSHWRTARDEILSSIGEEYVAGGNRVSPHPILGTLYFESSPSGTVQSELTTLGVPWSQVDAPSPPSFDVAVFANSYHLYEGGFEYTPISVGSSVSNQTYEPTAANPLGIVYRSGSVSLGSDVTVIGTVVATGDVRLDGDDIHIVAPNWSFGADGVEIDEPHLWPRLPSLISLTDDIETDDTVRAVVEGAIYAGGDLRCADLEYGINGSWLITTGTATASIIAPGTTLITTGGGASTALISVGNEAGLTIENTICWYRVKAVDATGGTFQIAGEVESASALPLQVRGRRTNSLGFYGPLFVNGGVQTEAPPSWSNVSNGTWSSKLNNWNWVNFWLNYNLEELISFLSYIDSPLNWLFSGDGRGTYGLGLEPVTQFARPVDAVFGFEPPLFRPSPGDANGDGAGYRWVIRNWREGT
ncbi:hypothetical protein [Stratiformator vulcanicus]|uniref:Uncharacterized protein n=1 Tax=Stratiformator vulcanicus TaxID=2527980 RepID=A0A517R573_9PLAN|nr:hypothetical protein [Stratiformator vulcanicus]QDT38973.1 hypothetical protein Pan189_33730 [Stratiformator vulcanicus]